MGEACEHFLYDKGYGPTNLTLKRHLAALFPMAELELPEAEERFPVVESTLIPIGDGPTARSRATGPIDRGKGAAASSGYTRVVTERPSTGRTAKARRRRARGSVPTTRKVPTTAKLPTTRRIPQTTRTGTKARGGRRRPGR
jgi:hypothetical protein